MRPPFRQWLSCAEAKLGEAERAHMAEVTTATAKVEAAERLIAKLRKLLDDALRPWWRRWLGNGATK